MNHSLQAFSAVSVQQVQLGAQNAALGCSSVKDKGGRGVSLNVGLQL